MVDVVTKKWPDKRVGEEFNAGADWSPILTTDTILMCSASVISGAVTIESSDQFSGAVQAVRLSGGTPGVAVVRCVIHTTPGDDTYYQDYKFGILPD